MGHGRVFGGQFTTLVNVIVNIIEKLPIPYLLSPISYLPTPGTAPLKPETHPQGPKVISSALDGFGRGVLVAKGAKIKVPIVSPVKRLHAGAGMVNGFAGQSWFQLHITRMVK